MSASLAGGRVQVACGSRSAPADGRVAACRSIEKAQPLPVGLCCCRRKSVKKERSITSSGIGVAGGVALERFSPGGRVALANGVV